MKKIITYLMATCLSLTVLSVQSNAATLSTVTTPADSTKANTLLLRLYEINSMDKSNLTSADKKELRKEVKLISSELKSENKGIYLSIGAVIIIILLLILLT